MVHRERAVGGIEAEPGRQVLVDLQLDRAVVRQRLPGDRSDGRVAADGSLFRSQVGEGVGELRGDGVAPLRLLHGLPGAVGGRGEHAIEQLGTGAQHAGGGLLSRGRHLGARVRPECALLGVQLGAALPLQLVRRGGLDPLGLRPRLSQDPIDLARGFRLECGDQVVEGHVRRPGLIRPTEA